ncbi:hypothetical protein KDH_59610 [Dictyobacter sp. S3.2.2.5]|uniref:N-acetyltransferase domain-containing protein n=1 Tax=Dictyobacter halimunensis TaxID=3026934 RepID=A0ABQ6G1L9_9CHLR|nr:hypothetical protein KDH_59610 [Dictyobacter sp. S3.2.2.5]
MLIGPYKDGGPREGRRYADALSVKAYSLYDNNFSELIISYTRQNADSLHRQFMYKCGFVKTPRFISGGEAKSLLPICLTCCIWDDRM